MAAHSMMLKRFTPVHRLFHLGLVVLFMLLSVTGLGWMFAETAWGQGLMDVFGGYANAIYVHRIAGLVMLAGFVAQIVYMATKISWRRPLSNLFGPDTLAFHWGDVKDFFRHAGWIVGLSREPSFERWSWWEKFDYWAVWWGLIIVGVTGLMIYDPVLSSDYMPGWFYNVALWVHRIEAVLAMGHIFTVHFFVEHFRPRNFPYSNTMFDGGMDVGHAREEHPAWVARLEAAGTLERSLMPVPPLGIRILHVFFGYSMIALGLFLLVAALVNFGRITLF